MYMSGAFEELKEELERNFEIEAVTGTFIQLPRLKKFMNDPENHHRVVWRMDS